MNELIKVTEENGKQVVSARELHKFLENTERFSNWFERQLQYGFEENVDYVGCKEFNTLANQELTDYAITTDTGKVFFSIKDAAESVGKDRMWLSMKLRGKHKNKTKFKFYE